MISILRYSARLAAHDDALVGNTFNMAVWIYRTRMALARLSITADHVRVCILAAASLHEAFELNAPSCTMPLLPCMRYISRGLLCWRSAGHGHCPNYQAAALQLQYIVQLNCCSVLQGKSCLNSRGVNPHQHSNVGIKISLMLRLGVRSGWSRRSCSKVSPLGTRRSVCLLGRSFVRHVEICID